jgi:phosphatidylcholine synthase
MTAPPANVTMSRALAWLVHLVTASGAVWGFLALVAIMEHRWQASFWWIAAAVFVDSVDGSLARLFRVKGVLPGFNGELLDNMVDYFTYVVVAAFLVFEAGLLPAGWELAGCAAILLASAYQFCQGDAKTSDHLFKGFPSYWNVVAFYLFVLNLNQWLNLAFLILLALLVFVPIRYVYPSRTSTLWPLTIVLSLLWGVAALVILSQIPEPSRWLIWLSLLYLLYYIGLSLYLTLWRGHDPG